MSLIGLASTCLLYGQTPSLQLVSAISFSSNPVPSGGYLTISAQVKNTGTSGTFDFECDLETTGGSYLTTIKKRCSVTISAGGTASLSFAAGGNPAAGGYINNSPGNYKVRLIALYSSCFGCGSGTSCSKATVAANGYQNPASITVGSGYCSGTTTLTSASGSFNDGSGSDFYNNNLNCSWLIQPSGASSVTLNFSSFDTENGFDYLKVYNGTSSSAPLLGTFSGSSVPAPVTSGSAMYIVFTSDGATIGGGWAASYTSSSGSSCTNSTNPTGASASSTSITSGNATSLSVSGGSLGSCGSWKWYSGACGATFVGTGSGSSGSLTVTPTATTTYFVRAEGGNTTNCASVTITVSSGSTCTNNTAATSATASPASVSSGGPSTLTVSGGSLGTCGSWKWYTDNCGTTLVGTGSGANGSLTVSPTVTTTYFARAEGNNSTGCVQATVTVTGSCTSNTAATSAAASPATITAGNNTTLTVSGGSLGSCGSWKWYTGSCGGILVGTGAGANGTLVVSPWTTTTYFARAEGGSPTTCVSVTVSVTAGAVISITSADVPDWGREGDAYNGSITVATSNPQNASWHLRVRVFDAQSGVQENVFDYAAITKATQQFYYDDPMIKQYAKSGKQLKFYAVLESNSASIIAGSMDIIEKKWDQNHVIFYNTGFNKLLIPLKYYPNTISTTISFTRVAGTSTSFENITSVPTVQFGNQRYFVLDNTTSLIESVAAGPMNYKIEYNPSAFATESGTFDLTKIGRIHNANGSSNQIVVLVGGFLNSIEDDIKILPNTYDANSGKAWSIANDLSLKYGKNVWYISTGNTNSIQKNAYDIGVALQQIKSVCIGDLHVSNPQISVIAHSKAGLEMRLLLDGKGAPIWSKDNFTVNPPDPFIDKTIGGSLKSTIFLGTPHHGSILAWAFKKTLGGADLLPYSQVIQYLNAQGYAQLANIRVANFSGFQIGLTGNVMLDVNGDGLVSLESSAEDLNINGAAIFRQYYIAKDYDPTGLENYLDYLLHTKESVVKDVLNGSDRVAKFISSLSFHIQLHRSSVLNNVANSCPGYTPVNAQSLNICSLKITPGTTSSLTKILSFIDNSAVAESCPSPNLTSCYSSGQAYASLLSHAAISKIDSAGRISLLTHTDSKGRFQFQISDSLPLGSKLLMEAPGIESSIMVIDSALFKAGKINFASIKSSTSPSRIKYPVVELRSSFPVTTTRNAAIKVSALNANNIEIATNQDTAFRALANADTTTGFALDSGMNVILVKFSNALDTVLQQQTIYMLTDSEYAANTYKLSVACDTSLFGTRVYANGNYISEISTANTVIPLLKGRNDVNFSRFGYRDYLLQTDSGQAINLTNVMSQIMPYKKSDSLFFDFTANSTAISVGNFTIADSSRKKKLSLRQYDTSYSKLALVTKSRQFDIKQLNNSRSELKVSAVLDQPNSPSPAEMYLLSISDDTLYKKVFLNDTAQEASYDSIAQLLTYDHVGFNNGSGKQQSLVLMKKQPPVSLNVGTFVMNENDTLRIPVNRFLSDPDSIKNDMVYSAGSTGQRLSITLKGDSIQLVPDPCWNGNNQFSVNATHDRLSTTTTAGLTVNPTPAPSITALSSLIFCKGKSVVLSTTGGVKYTWSNGDTTPTTVVTAQGNYSVTVKDKFGCIRTSSSVVVTVLPLPVFNPGIDQFVCFGNSVQIGGPAVSGNVYAWTPYGSLNSPIVAAPVAQTPVTTIYTEKVTGSNGCIDSSKIKVTVLDLPLVVSGGNKTICLKDSVLIGSAQYGTENSYQWSPPGGLKDAFAPATMASPSATTSYTLTVRGSNGCYDSARMTLTVNPLPVIDLPPAYAVCIGSSISIGIPSVAGSAYQWTPAAALSSSNTATTIARPVISTDFSLLVINSFGCKLTKNTRVTVNPLPSVNAGPPLATDRGASVTIGGRPAASGNSPFSYSWLPTAGLSNPAIANPLAAPNVTTRFLLKVTDKNGCQDTAGVKIFVTPTGQHFLLYPNPVQGETVNLIGAQVSDGWYRIRLYAMNGQEAGKPQQAQAINQSLFYPISLAGLPTGIYIVRIEKDGVVINLQVRK
jgi:hypothetical protein